MLSATDSVKALCDQLGVTPIWSEINKKPPTVLVLNLVTIASDLACGLDMMQVQERSIGALLDGGTRPIPAETYARVAIQMGEVRDFAVDRGRALLGDLLVAGLVR